MFYSYTNLIHKHATGFYNKISPQRSLSKLSTAYCIPQDGTKKSSMTARWSRIKAPSVTELLNSGLQGKRRGRVDVTPANALVPRSFKIYPVVSDHPN